MMLLGYSLFFIGVAQFAATLRTSYVNREKPDPLASLRAMADPMAEEASWRNSIHEDFSRCVRVVLS